MDEVKCRRCKQKIPSDVALYVDAEDRPTKTPICPPCFEDVVRGIARGVRGAGKARWCAASPYQPWPGEGSRDM